MKDISVLERAAAAAGIPVRRVNGVLFTEVTDALGERVSVEWNPLKDDGDAFRLLVALGEIVTVDPGDDNMNTRARRAIVDAAVRRKK